MEENEKRKANGGLVVLVVLLFVVCAVMGTYIFMNKDKLTGVSNPEDKVIVPGDADISETTDTSIESLLLDNSHWEDENSVWVPIENGVGTEYKGDPRDRKKVNVLVRWPLTLYGSEKSGSSEYAITFDQEVVEIVASSNGQSANLLTVFFLMKDGSVYSFNESCALKGENFQIAQKMDGLGKVINLYKTFAFSKDSNLTSGSNLVIAQTSEQKIQMLTFSLDNEC